MSTLTLSEITDTDEPFDYYPVIARQYPAPASPERGDGLDAARGIGFGIMISIVFWAAVFTAVKVLYW